MSRSALCLMIISLGLTVSASWYWPFGSDEKDPPRLSELMAPASTLIDEASDLAADGKVSEAVEKYREALKKLDAIEKSDPKRAKTPEFATLRNKRAYVSAAIDSMLLSQVKGNAKAVAVSDTQELESRLAAERAGLTNAVDKATNVTDKATNVVSKATNAVDKVTKTADKANGTGGRAEKGEKPVSRKPLTPREQAIEDINRGDFDAAAIVIEDMLAAKPNNALALNLKAGLEVRRGNLDAAESALDQAILSNPRSHYAYYNMADLVLKKSPGSVKLARRYYETGRSVGGPEDAGLEAALK